MPAEVPLGWVGKTRRSLGALMEGLYPGVGVDPFETGEECANTITIKLRLGPSTPGTDCICTAQFVIAPYIDICFDASGITPGYDILDRLVGPCGEESIMGRLGAVGPGPNTRWHGVPLLWEDERLGAVKSVDPAVGYGVARFNDDGPPKTVSAQIVVTVTSKCCGGG